MIEILKPLLGGILIGLSSSLMLGGLGRITGISGILSSSLVSPTKVENWRVAFLIGLIGGGFVIFRVRPDLFSYNLEFPLVTTVVAGLLVGFGTQLGSGCTSGHGVCGLPRMAKRSLVATLTFIGAGMVTVTLIRILL